jgi:ABC-2 type transport system permease protein
MMRTLIAKELREQRRTHRLLITIAVLLIAGLISPLLARYTPLLLGMVPGLPPEMAALIPEPSLTDAFAQYIKNVSQFGLLVVIVVSMGMIAQEVERGTAAMLLTKPVRRAGVVLAKWSAGLLVLLGGLALSALGFAFYTLVLFGAFSPADLLAVSGLLVVFLLFYFSLGLLASALAPNQGLAAAGAFGGLLLVLIVDALPWLGDYLPGDLLTWGGQIAAGEGEAAWGALLVTLLLTGVFVAGAVGKFRRQEL